MHISTGQLSWCRQMTERVVAGATRGILGLPGIEEDVGMIGLHHAGVFYELVPWTGEVQWEVLAHLLLSS
jgi:hypothetical protein